MTQRVDTPAGPTLPAIDLTDQVGHSVIGGPLGAPIGFFLEPPVDQVLSSP